MHIHFLGIGGSGASAAAAIAKSEGYKITGCDLNPFNEFTSVFSKEELFEGHSPDHLKNVDILAVTPAIFSLDPQNPELLEAKQKKIQILTWQEFMAQYLMKNEMVIAVCGTHGKTTTTAMIAKMLEDAGLDPTCEMGAIVPSWGANYRIGKKKYFIIEADEFNDNFLAFKPDLTVVTTIEYDHPEYFKDFEDYKKSFTKFLSQTNKVIIANLSDEGVKEVLDVHLEGTRLKVFDFSAELVNFPLKIPGDFNLLNASAVYKVGLELQIDPKIIQKSLQNFNGLSRRFEKLGEFQGATVYSDFGHHPTEIRVTLQTLRDKFPDQKITVIFQPHMFSRTKALFSDFVKVLKEAPVDQIYILDIYPSREVDTGLISSQDLVEQINLNNIIYAGSKDKLLQKIRSEAKKDDILFFQGAGDINKIARKLISD